MADVKNMYWDSCVLINYITKVPENTWSDLSELIEDAKKGERTIFLSTITLVEVRPRHFLGTKWRTVIDFFEDLRGAFRTIEPTPDILIRAGELRDAQPINPATQENSTRSIGTPDAIHLMTCLHLRDVRKIADIVFHTFDNGKGTTWEGKCVSLLEFEKWFPPLTRAPRVREVCELARVKPSHPQPRLVLVSNKAGA